jgi:hypothetical protein
MYLSVDYESKVKKGGQGKQNTSEEHEGSNEGRGLEDRIQSGFGEKSKLQLAEEKKNSVI